MTEENLELDSSPDVEERDQITISIPLDPAHKRMDVAIRDHLKDKQLSIEDLISQAVGPQVEQALYRNLQDMKYSEQ